VWFVNGAVLLPLECNYLGFKAAHHFSSLVQEHGWRARLHKTQRDSIPVQQATDLLSLILSDSITNVLQGTSYYFTEFRTTHGNGRRYIRLCLFAALKTIFAILSQLSTSALFLPRRNVGRSFDVQHKMICGRICAALGQRMSLAEKKRLTSPTWCPEHHAHSQNVYGRQALARGDVY
jgi:hypothetical protein